MSTNVTYPVAVSHLVVEVTEFLSSLTPKNAYPAGFLLATVTVPSLARSRSGPAVLTASADVPKPPFTVPNDPVVLAGGSAKSSRNGSLPSLPLHNTFVKHGLLTTASAADGTSANAATASNGARLIRNFLDIAIIPLVVLTDGLGVALLKVAALGPLCCSPFLPCIPPAEATAHPRRRDKWKV